MPHRREQPYATEHRRVLEYLDRLTPAEGDALLRRTGILDDSGHLATRYKAGGEPVNGAETTAPSKVTR